jgi:hypothetical protein
MYACVPVDFTSALVVSQPSGQLGWSHELRWCSWLPAMNYPFTFALRGMFGTLIVALALAVPTFAGQDLFNARGEAVAFISGERVVNYDDGATIAFIDYQGRDASPVFSLRGKHIGWYQSGAFYNLDGNATMVTSDRFMGVTSIAPIRPIEAISPITPIFEIPGIAPIFSNRFVSSPAIQASAPATHHSAFVDVAPNPNSQLAESMANFGAALGAQMARRREARRLAEEQMEREMQVILSRPPTRRVKVESAPKSDQPTGDDLPWNGLTKGMSRKEAQQRIGKPATIEGTGGVQKWIYPDGGWVYFRNYFVFTWVRPTAANSDVQTAAAPILQTPHSSSHSEK